MTSKNTPSRKQLKDLLADESGQASTEYVLLLVVLIVIIKTLGSALRARMEALVKGPLSDKMRREFFKPGGVHQFPMRNVN